MTGFLTRKAKIESEKSLGPFCFIYRRAEYKPIGPRKEDGTSSRSHAECEALIKEAKTVEDLKQVFYEGVDPGIRAKVWRMLFKYVPVKSGNEATILLQSRAEYKELCELYTETRFAQQNDSVVLDTIKLIRRDVLRTLPDSKVFRDPLVQRAMVRALMIYSIRHPSNLYSQGMNDILAPIFAVFLADYFGLTSDQLQTDPSPLERVKGDDWILMPEADAYNCFALLLSGMKANYVKGFEGVTESLKKMHLLISKADKELSSHLEKNEVEIFHFCFRWVFCLMLREVPLNLSIKLIDYYLVEEYPPSELCLYLALALLLRYSKKVKELQREQIIIYLQSLPTAEWGEQDIQLLVSEAYALRAYFNK